MATPDSGKTAAKAWLRQQQRAGSKAARPVLLLHLAGTLAGIGQAVAAALALTGAISSASLALAPVAAFAVLALLRAVLVYSTEQTAFAAGAAARRRLRSDALTRLLGAGPALLRERHSGDLASIVVDRVEAVDGLFSRYVPAATFAAAGPVLVLLAVLWIDPFAAMMLAICGFMVPVGMALA